MTDIEKSAIDRDLVAARKLCAMIFFELCGESIVTGMYESGKCDSSEEVVLALDALRKARAEGPMGGEQKPPEEVRHVVQIICRDGEHWTVDDSVRPHPGKM